jgi:hypothetical protein
MDERTNNDLQNTTQKTKDWATRILPKTGNELGCTGRVNISCSTNGTRRVAHVTNPVMNEERPWLLLQ